MTAHQSRYPIESPNPPARPPGPTVFVRTFSTPAGMPWDQARVAALEAKSGAPLPLVGVIYQIRRLDPWSPKRAARYAAFYVRASEAGEDLTSTVEVNGRPMRVRFLSKVERNRRARRLGLLAAVTGGMALAVSGAVTSAFAVREETAARLDAVEKIAAAKHRIARTAERERRMAEALDAAGVTHLKLSDAVADLAWASGAKMPAVRIEAFHWDHGHVAVEVRGEGAPFGPGRGLVKANKPLRPGVWLWGVEPQTGAAP
jgi:hypothetical protein